MPIDQGIFEMVVALNMLGFRTVMSCEGHLEKGIAGPWVDIESDEIQALRDQITAKLKEATPSHKPPYVFTDEAKTLIEQLKKPQLEIAHALMILLDQFYRQREYIAYDQRLIPNIWDSAPGKVSLECMGTSFQDIAPQNVKELKLKAYQQEMQDFTAFLKALIV
jgi:hypothetical protein